MRVKTAEVKTILPSSTGLTDAQLCQSIVAANCTVDRVAVSCGAGYTDACLKQIELYLAAHYAAATENTLSLVSEKDPCCGGSATYGFKFGEGVKGTPFGQMANTLSYGCLAELDKAPIGMFAIGAH